MNWFLLPLSANLNGLTLNDVAYTSSILQYTFITIANYVHLTNNNITSDYFFTFVAEQCTFFMCTYSDLLSFTLVTCF